MRFWKCEFGEKWDFKNVNLVKSEFSKYEFLDKLRIFAPVWRRSIKGIAKNTTIVPGNVGYRKKSQEVPFVSVCYFINSLVGKEETTSFSGYPDTTVVEKSTKNVS